ncbi:MAG: hypothetical protein ABEH43_06690, partial [Flavobacteriales bacterium]
MIIAILLCNVVFAQYGGYRKDSVSSSDTLNKDPIYWGDTLSNEKEFLRKQTHEDSLRYVSKKHVHELKEGILLVRLQSFKRRINIMK